MRNFDQNATHPLAASARVAWLDAVERFPANPSSPHRWGARAAAALDEAREKVACWLGCSPPEVVWASGATEANNAVLHHLGRSREGRILVSAIEHPSVTGPARRWLPDRLEWIPTARSGVVDLNWIRDRLRQGEVGAVVLMAANNETGVLQPWQEARELCAAHATPLVCDAAQWLGKLPADGLGDCAMMSACAHKFGGPQGVGLMKSGADLLPLIVGGPQEAGRRAGTENVAGILAMVAALEERQVALASPGRTSPEAVKLRQRWRDQFVAGLKAALPEVEIVGEGAGRLWNTVSALMPAARDCRRRWVVKLDRLGFAASTGSACASGKEKPSPVLASMGYRPDESDRMLRFSSGWETRESDWVDLLQAVRQAAVELLDEPVRPNAAV